MKSRNFQNKNLNLPNYGIPEAAHYLKIPKSTVRAWVKGYPYKKVSEKGFFRPLIQIADPAGNLLSFSNLVEVHLLFAIRKIYKVEMQKVRKAIAYLENRYHSNHPLLEKEFETDGIDLFIKESAKLINISQEGQLAFRKLLELYLHRVERDAFGRVVKLYPFVTAVDPHEPRGIVIDPDISFGRPVLTGTGIATEIIAERYFKRESIEELAKDYGVELSLIEEGIRYESYNLQSKAA